MTTLSPGDRVITPLGNTGTVQRLGVDEADTVFALIQIDHGSLLWIAVTGLTATNTPKPYTAPVKR